MRCQRPRQGNGTFSGRTCGQPTIVDLELFRFAHDHRTLDDVLQLAHISWPWIRLQVIERSRVYALKCLAGFLCVAFDEILDQLWNILAPLSQWRHFHRENVQTIKEIS